MDGLWVPGALDKHALIEVLPLDGLYVPAAQDKHALIDVLLVYGLYTLRSAEAGRLGANLPDGHY